MVTDIGVGVCYRERERGEKTNWIPSFRIEVRQRLRQRPQFVVSSLYDTSYLVVGDD